MTNIEKLIKKYGIEIVKRIPEEQGHLSHVIAYGVQISMYELIEHLKMSEYIASYKHLIGCEFYLKDRRQKGKFIINVFTDNAGCISHVHCNVGYEYRFIHHTDLMLYLDDGSHVNDSVILGTYKQYMQLHYPEYVHVWKHQL